MHLFFTDMQPYTQNQCLNLEVLSACRENGLKTEGDDDFKYCAVCAKPTYKPVHGCLHIQMTLFVCDHK